MQSSSEPKNTKNFSLSKMIVSIVALCFALVSIIAHQIEYVSPICALIAIIMGAIILVKRIDNKVLAIIAMILGLSGGVLGGIVTVNAMIATFGWGQEIVFSHNCENEIDSENCNELESNDQEDTKLIEEANEKMRACLEEKGIDPEIDYEDLADAEKDASDECYKNL